MAEWPLGVTARGAARVVVFLGDDSIYFTALDSVLSRKGWRTVRLAIDHRQIAAALMSVRALAPELILIGSWQCPSPDDPLLLAFAAEPRAGSLLVICDGADPVDDAALISRVGRREPVIPCTAAAVDAFLRAACSYAAEPDLPAPKPGNAVYPPGGPASAIRQGDRPAGAISAPATAVPRSADPQT